MKPWKQHHTASERNASLGKVQGQQKACTYSVSDSRKKLRTVLFGQKEALQQPSSIKQFFQRLGDRLRLYYPTNSIHWQGF